MLNARRHRSGNYRRCQTDPVPSRRVLNARRHRSGNYLVSPIRVQPASGAQRPKASERELLDKTLTDSFAGEECSTPEGIGAGITVYGSHPRNRSAVLNARRHRSGNYLTSTGPIAPGRCAQRPKASERELLTVSPTRWTFTSGAQRPKASERELRVCSSALAHSCTIVLNARRHRSGNYLTLRSLDVSLTVLNARRHRSGNYRPPSPEG